MGVLNVTPDSFSDGGRFPDPAAAAGEARRLVEQGADILDVGGESTRPGSDPVSEAEQIARVVPVIAAARDLRCVVSVDTTRSAVAAAALDAGAALLNDVSAGRDDPAMLALAAARGVPIVLMHMRGTPKSMQADPRYDDVVAEVLAFLRERTGAAVAAGVPRHRVLWDVGVGFGKADAHNLSLLRHHARFAADGHATVLGTSRKGFLGRLTGVARPADRAFGTAATVAWGAANGASIHRVHDVAEMRQVLAIVEAIRGA